MKHYEEPIVKILVLSVDDVVRMSRTNENGIDNDGRWDSVWDDDRS